MAQYIIISIIIKIDLGTWYRQLYVYKYIIISIIIIYISWDLVQCNIYVIYYQLSSASALYKDRSWDLVQTAGEDWLRQLPQVLFEQACKDHRDHLDHRDHRDHLDHRDYRDGIKSSFCFVDIDMVN